MRGLSAAPVRAAAGLIAAVAGCAGGDGANGAAEVPPTGACEPAVAVARLPAALFEASGVARDPRGTGLFWVHNDSGNPAELVALDAAGAPVASLPVSGASDRDLEDVAAGSCDGRPCLYLADIGDNLAVHPTILVHRVPLPPVGEAASSLRATGAWRLAYPGGPRDAEGLAVDGERGEILVVTKGREGAIELYAASTDGLREATPDSPPDTLRRVGRLALPIGNNTAQFVTAADLSPDGTRFAVRSYSTVYLFDWPGAAAFDTASAPRHSSLLAALEAQGEGLAWTDDGETLMLVSEGRGARPPSFSRIRCPS